MPSENFVRSVLLPVAGVGLAMGVGIAGAITPLLLVFWAFGVH